MDSNKTLTSAINSTLIIFVQIQPRRSHLYVCMIPLVTAISPIKTEVTLFSLCVGSNKRACGRR